MKGLKFTFFTNVNEMVKSGTQSFSKNLADSSKLTASERWQEATAEGRLRTRHGARDLCAPGPNQEVKVRNIGQVNAPYRVWSETIRGKEPLLDKGMDSSTILKWEFGTAQREAADWIQWSQVGSSDGLSLARRPAFGFWGLRTGSATDQSVGNRNTQLL